MVVFVIVFVLFVLGNAKVVEVSPKFLFSYFIGFLRVLICT